MKLNRLAALALLLAGFALAGCEDEYCMAQWILPDGSDSGSKSESGSGSKPSQGSGSKSESGSGKRASGEVSGVWHGRAGTGQTSTTLRLNQNGNSLSGSWTWGAGDRRSCSGSVSGNSVVLKDTRSTGDTWHLTLSSDGRSLSGTGMKYGGGSYHVSFTR